MLNFTEQAAFKELEARVNGISETFQITCDVHLRLQHELWLDHLAKLLFASRYPNNPILLKARVWIMGYLIPKVLLQTQTIWIIIHRRMNF
jgi:hypothetical protein